MNSNIKSVAEQIFSDQHNKGSENMTKGELVSLIEKRLFILYEDGRKLGRIQVINHISGELDKCNPERRN